METGVFVLGMHRSGTSAATRLISLLGLEAPRGDDLVSPSAKNPTGYWESMSLVAFNERVLQAIGSDFTCPIALEGRWQDDARLAGLRAEAPEIFRRAFPRAPWVWKDPRTCLTFAFWRTALDVQPVIVLLNRNPLEIVVSTARTSGKERRIYTIALWERHLRQALLQISGLPVMVADYADLLSAPLAWCDRAHAFLSRAGVPVQRHRETDVLGFVDTALRHAELDRADVLSADEVSDSQRRLFLVLESLQGEHLEFVPPSLPPETPTTEALLSERMAARQIERELTAQLELERRSGHWRRVRNSRYLSPARRAYANVRHLIGGVMS